MAACRVATYAEELGLHNAAVIGFKEDEPLWRWSTTLRVTNDSSGWETDLLHDAKNSPTGVHRTTHDDKVIVVSVLGSPLYPVLFIQMLPPNLANQKHKERLNEN